MKRLVIVFFLVLSIIVFVVSCSKQSQSTPSITSDATLPIGLLGDYVTATPINPTSTTGSCPECPICPTPTPTPQYIKFEESAFPGSGDIANFSDLSNCIVSRALPGLQLKSIENYNDDYCSYIAKDTWRSVDNNYKLSEVDVKTVEVEVTINLVAPFDDSGSIALPGAGFSYFCDPNGQGIDTRYGYWVGKEHPFIGQKNQPEDLADWPYEGNAFTTTISLDLDKKIVTYTNDSGVSTEYSGIYVCEKPFDFGFGIWFRQYEGGADYIDATINRFTIYGVPKQAN